jgi:hypothetical protein
MDLKEDVIAEKCRVLGEELDEFMRRRIAATTTRQGLHVSAELDKHSYPLGTKITNAQIATLSLERADFHGEWNYTIHPN